MTSFQGTIQWSYEGLIGIYLREIFFHTDNSPLGPLKPIEILKLPSISYSTNDLDWTGIYAFKLPGFKFYH